MPNHRIKDQSHLNGVSEHFQNYKNHFWLSEGAIWTKKNINVVEFNLKIQSEIVGELLT